MYTVLEKEPDAKNKQIETLIGQMSGMSKKFSELAERPLALPEGKSLYEDIEVDSLREKIQELEEELEVEKNKTWFQKFLGK